jgi:hypothetical protein
MPSSSTFAPAIVRVAGIGADFLDRLILEESSAGARVSTLREALRELQRQVAEALYYEIPRHASGARRLLLELRRGCHNGCGIAHRLGDALRLDLQCEGLAALLRQLADLERQAAEAESAYTSEYDLRRQHELQVLSSPLQGQALRRGLTLASPSFSAAIDDLCVRKPHGLSRRSNRPIHTLARYVTRSALKLSPYSTLTPVALAAITPRSGEIVRYLPGGRATASNLRVKRYLLDQCCEILRRAPSVRPHLSVCLNSTLRRVGEDSYRFLRPPQLQPGEDSSTLQYSRFEQITVRVRGSLAAFLFEHPPNGPLIQLIRDLPRALSLPDTEEESLSHGVDQLIEIGFLSLVFPIRSYDPHFEGGLRDFLSALPPSPSHAEASSLLEEIVRLEDSFSTASDPAGVTASVEAAVEDLHRAAQSGLSEGVSVRLQKNPEHNLYEDCFEVSAVSPTGAVLEIDEDALRTALDAGNLVWQIAGAHETRHEVLLTLDAFLEQRFPGLESVPVLDLFERFRPLWEQYLTFLAERSGASFNPFALPAISDLADLRLRLQEELRGTLESTEAVDYYPLAGLRRIVHSIPRRWLNPLGPSLFLQPADSQASAWVVNRIFEGNGRMSSRYTTVMPNQVRERYLQHYRRRSTLEIDGEHAELLDLQYTKKNTANAHIPQTSKVLLIPGEVLGAGDAQAVELRDLFVRRTPNRPLAIVDVSGNRLVPSFLSPLANPFMPSILKFLDAFGLGVRGNYQFPSASTHSAGMTCFKRQMVGNLILNRAFWKLDRNLLPPPTLEPAEFFLQLQRWRSEAGIPSEVYILERVYDVAFHGEVTKPQYLRFDSVILAELLRELLLKTGEPLTFVEAVPGAGDFPRDPEFGRRAVEVIVEWLALTPAYRTLSFSPSGELYQQAELKISAI